MLRSACCVGGRRVLKGFGSNAEGAMIRVNNSDLLLFSHSNDINGTANRWNMTVWASWDSGATWEPALQAEPDGTLPGSTVPCAALDLLPSDPVKLPSSGMLPCQRLAAFLCNMHLT